MKKFLALMVALAMVMSFGAMAFAAGSPSGGDVAAAHGDKAGALIVKFHTGEIRVATPFAAPYSDEQNTAIALAGKVVKGKDSVADETLKAFFEANSDNLAEGIITLGEEAVAEGSVKLAVSAKGFDKVLFTAPGNADKLGFVVIYG